VYSQLLYSFNHNYNSVFVLGQVNHFYGSFPLLGGVLLALCAAGTSMTTSHKIVMSKKNGEKLLK